MITSLSISSETHSRAGRKGDRPLSRNRLLSGPTLGSLARAFVQGWVTISQVREGAQTLLLVVSKLLTTEGGHTLSRIM